MRVGIGWSVVLLAAAVVGCRGESASVGKVQQGELARGTVSHVVVCWLKEPGNEGQRRELVERSLTFREIPGVVSVAAGVPLASTRPAVDSSYDVAVVMRFKDEAALRAYDSDPTHQRAVREVLRPSVKKLVIYDAIDR